MKFNYLLLSALALLTTHSFAQEGFDDFDDVYSDNTRQIMKSSSSQASSTEYVKGEDPGTWIEQDEYYDPSYSSTSDSSSGNTYITNNYYGGNYHYSDRFNRFNNVNNGWNDPYWNNGWNSWGNPGWNSWGAPGWNSWGNPGWNSWGAPGWNVGWNSWNGWGAGYNVGWGNPHRFNRWGNPYALGGWNHYNPYWNNGWGYNGWGNNGWAYNQGFTHGVLAANGGGFESNSRGVSYGHRGSRGSGTRVSSVYGDRRSGARVYNSSGKSIEKNATAYTGSQTQGFSRRATNTPRQKRSIESNRSEVKTNPIRMDNASRTTTRTRGNVRQGQPSPLNATNSKPRTNPSLPRTAKPTTLNSGRSVTVPGQSRITPSRTVPKRNLRPSARPNRVAIGSPSRATVGSSTPRRTAPATNNGVRSTPPSRRYTPSQRSVTPTRSYQPNRTSPSRSRNYKPSRSTPNRSYTPSRSTPSRSYTPSRSTSPSRGSSSPSRSSGGSSRSSSGSSRGGRR